MKKYFFAMLFICVTGSCFSQNVGVGITIPIYPFHVVSAPATTTGYFDNSNSTGDALTGQNSAAAGTALGAGVTGITNQTNIGAAGVFGMNLNVTGTGVSGGGNGGSVKTLAAGSGGSFTGNTNGLVGFATTNASGTGVIGAGNNLSPFTLAAGSGGAFTGSATGLYVRNNVNGADGTSQAIYSINGFTGAAGVVNYWSSVQQFKIVGSGSVSTLVKDLQNKQVIMYAPESPEDYFQDFGEGQLVEGRTHIMIDPILAKNITINNKHPLRVFIQPEGDCKGVYVTNKTANGFDVVELNGGQSNISFQWSITCNRADEKLANGLVSKNADARFNPLPELPKAAEAEVKEGNPRKN